MRPGLIAFIFALAAPVAGFGQTAQAAPLSLNIYAGPETNTPLLELIKVSKPRIENYALVAVGFNRELARTERFLALELDGQLAKFLERADLFAASLAFDLRVLEMPWQRFAPGTFAFGVGLSYATSIPEIEAITLGRSSKLLLQLVIEYEFLMSRDGKWSGFLRDHHRSGIFGLINGVIGGSDYLCLGLRMRL